ncbi:alpha/beta hydrolase [Turneriella parva]|uniref:alpha/beta hydrolase n=1 Tax=Turneriella parva TaxID=29510 RepID=UPI0005A5198A|nr:alpha/beta hydrolase [Turneriella parva]
MTNGTSKELFLSEIKAQIITKKKNVLLGVSFGALVAQDIASAVSAETLIVISSATEQAEIPRFYKGSLAKFVLRMMPNRLLNKPNFLINHMFSVQTNDGQKTLGDIIRDTDPTFIRWAIAYLQQWQKPNLSTVKHIYRIHGEGDRIFPNVNAAPETSFVHGGHFAIYETADEVNRCLKLWL